MAQPVAEGNAGGGPPFRRRTGWSILPTVTADFDYGDAPVREDIRAAHRAFWDHLRSPGAWWTGAERVAIAAESRLAETCDLCVRRKAALSPGAVAGEHGGTELLPAAVVEVIHRVRTDPARLSRPWYDGIVAAGLEPPAYVEVIGVVTMLAGVDAFARALGVEPFPLPGPAPGAPSRHLPESARAAGAWVPMIAPEDASGPEADLYPAGTMIPNIVRALSLVPDEARMMQVLGAAHYLSVERIHDPLARRTLNRPQMELVAARVSLLNQCFY